MLLEYDGCHPREMKGEPHGDEGGPVHMSATVIPASQCMHLSVYGHMFVRVQFHLCIRVRMARACAIRRVIRVRGSCVSWS